MVQHPQRGGNRSTPSSRSGFFSRKKGRKNGTLSRSAGRSSARPSKRTVPKSTHAPQKAQGAVLRRRPGGAVSGDARARKGGVQNSSSTKKAPILNRLFSKIGDMLRGNAEFSNADSTLISLLAIIIIFGLVMLSSAGAVKGYQDFQDPYYLLKHQVLNGVLIGSIGFYVFANIDYHYWRKYAFPIMVATLILLFAVFIPGLGEERLGAKRWINIGGFDFQPSEIVKMTFLIYLAAWLEKHGKNIHDPKYGLGSFLAMLGLIVLLIAVGQKDLGTTIVIGAIAVVVYFVGGAPWKHLLGLGGLGFVAFLILVKIAPYRLARVAVFLNPDTADKSGIGYHVHQALIAIGSGGLFGLGLGHSQQKFNYLPEVHTDSIFAIISEELGFFFAVGVIILFTFFVLRALKIAEKAPDEFGRLLAVGIATWVGFQAVVNIAAMLSLLPLTGIPLPFVSYGSSAMITLLSAVGILVNISRQTHLKKAVKKSL